MLVVTTSERKRKEERWGWGGRRRELIYNECIMGVAVHVRKIWGQADEPACTQRKALRPTQKDGQVNVHGYVLK